MFEWTTKQGEKLPLTVMTAEHIADSIKWLIDDSDMSDEKDGASVRQWIAALTEELARRASY